MPHDDSTASRCPTMEILTTLSLSPLSIQEPSAGADAIAEALRTSA